MDGFRTPPAGDFASYEALLGHQGEHFGALASWSTGQCANSSGLDGLLLPLQALVPEVSQFFDGKLAQCGRGMHLVGDKINQTSAEYTSTDHGVAGDMRSLYPSAFSGFPSIASIPGASSLGNFQDAGVDLKEPADANETTSKAIHLQVMALRGHSDLKMANTLFQWCTGQNLFELLLHPLFGEFGRLSYLSHAYDQLGDAVYTVAGTLRKGTWKLGSEWVGQTGTNFDQYLFQWSMGIGGVGDAAKVTAKAFKVAYEAMIPLVHQALKEIADLVETEIAALARQFVEMAAGTAAIEAAGLGPEDPLADVAALIWDVTRLMKIYKIVKRIITAIVVIQAIYEQIRKLVDAIGPAIDYVVKQVNSPMPTMGSLVNDVEQRGFEFEKDGFWSSTAGSARIAMLPAA
ncbi:uncharacterized protein YukE [Streptacidiphilus sp. MAP12-20]|uniref:hypothetical protein n=1 Tax=Streptacidiphilus sp. MAP12-20 TaxID=3156299 RepID=UPI0035197C2A